MSGKMHVGMAVDAARADIGFASLADLIRIAYNVKAYQVSGPDWMSSHRFDILAKMPEGANKDQVPAMLQALLVDRFKLNVHRDTSEHSVYALVIGKNSLKLRGAANEPESPKLAAEGDTPPSKPGVFVMNTAEGQMRVERSSDGRGGTVAGGPLGTMKFSMGEPGTMRMEFARIAMPGLAEMLTRFTDRPVIDMTGLRGNYQVGLDVSMEEMRVMARAAAASAGVVLPEGGFGRAPGEPRTPSPADAASTPAGTSILRVVQQLGLKLEPRKARVEIIVVDHLEKNPTEN